jgi:hypothetical protein
MVQASPLLRYALLADAAAGAPVGLLMALVAQPIGNLLGLPDSLLRYAGWFLFVFAALIGLRAISPRLSSVAVWTVIALNTLWVLGSLGLLLGGWFAPSGLGYAFVIFQSALVASFVGFQYVGLQRSRATSGSA